MEFNEKLQELRKNKNLTQEELAKELYVSRTAISKWESGRGYPNIDSLKDISKFFSVTIDELLSSEELITAAKDENRSNIIKVYDMLLGITDIMTAALMLLPLYPAELNGMIISVSLSGYDISLWIQNILWTLFTAAVLTGAVKLFMNHRNTEKGRGVVTQISFVISIVTVLFLTMTRAPYAVTAVFFLLIIKGVLAFRMPK